MSKSRSNSQSAGGRTTGSKRGRSAKTTVSKSSGGRVKAKSARGGQVKAKSARATNAVRGRRKAEAARPSRSSVARKAAKVLAQPADVEPRVLRDSARQVSRALSGAAGGGRLITPEEAGLAETPLPVDALVAASEVMRKLANGKHPSLLVLDDNDELTSEQAAAILGVSRPHLNQILDAEGIPHRRVGDAERGHRRIKREQVMALKERRERSAERMDELMRLSEQLAD